MAEFQRDVFRLQYLRNSLRTETPFMQIVSLLLSLLFILHNDVKTKLARRRY